MVQSVGSVKFSSHTTEINGLQKPLNTSYALPKEHFEENAADISPETKKKYKTVKIIGAVLGGIMISLGCIRILPKSVSKKFDVLKDYLTNKSEEIVVSSKMGVFYRKALSHLRNVTEKARGFNNFVSFKDIWFKRRISDRIPFMKKICDGITRTFDKIGFGVVKKSYSASVKKFNKLNRLYTNIESEILKDGEKIVEIKGISKTKADWVKELAQKRENLMNIIQTNFGENGILIRNQKLKSLMTELENDVWAASFGEKSNLKKKDTYFTFWADKFLASNKSKYASEMNKIQSSISFTPKDRAKMCEELLYSGKKFVHPQDIASERVVRDVNKLLSEYKSVAGKNFAKAQELSTAISKKMDEYDKIINHGKETFKYDDKIISAINEQNSQIRTLINSSKSGCIDDMNEIYKILLKERDYRQLNNQSRMAINSLDGSINKETNDYFDKLRDWTLGAAPTDVLGVMSGFATMGTALALTNNKDKRESILLKAGIPALGGTAVTMFMTARLISGVKCFSAGIISTIILNKLGALADNKRKQAVAQKLQQTSVEH